MTFINRLLSVGVLLLVSVNAVSISHNDARAHHHHVGHVERDAEGLVEKHVGGTELVERGGGKVGIAWSGNPDSNLGFFSSSKTKYFYNWSPYCPPEAKKHGLVCCPMLWGTKQIAQFEQLKRKGGKCIMGMNEVNVPSQGLLSVGAGVRLWNQHIRPMANEGYDLITPSVTSGMDGYNWLKQFFEQCGGPGNHCQATGLAWHFYGTKVADFVQWANKFHSLFPGDLWVTEIACQNFGNPSAGQCSKDQVWAFMDGTTAWMDKTSWIKAYFFFGAFWNMYNVNPANRMVNPNGKPNALGYHYIGH